MFLSHTRKHVINLYLTSLIIVILATKSLQTSDSSSIRKSLQLKYLPEAKFGYNEYAEYPDNDEGEKGPQAPQWSQLPSREISQSQSTSPPHTGSITGEIELSITWDDKWPSKEIEFGQLSAVSIDPNGNVAVFHRGSRVWGTGSFDADNKFDREQGPVRENTIVLINSAGKKIAEWGRSLFYLPHGLTVDYLGNYWITDVAMHQVFKFNAKDVQAEVKRSSDIYSKNNNLHTPSAIKPALTLGQAFEPGNDKNRFCKPTAVAVQKNGDFFVSDGYCNSRIIKFNQNGERILSWGRKWVLQENLMGHPRPANAFFVPHALALAEDLDFVFVADREDGRISCFHANNGTFHKEYKHPVIGSRIFSVAYAKEKIYAVNGPEFLFHNAHVRGFVIDINTGSVQSQFAPGKDMENPHDIAVSQDGRSIYVVELNPYQVHKFSQEMNSTLSSISNRVKPMESALATDVRPSLQPLSARGPSLLTDANSANHASKEGRRNGSGTTATTIILSLVTAAVILVALCVAVAAIVARCRKRGCLLLTARRGMQWESGDRRENFKLSNLLESRKSKGGRKFFEKRPNTRDFSKLNTEPETSDDENNLTKMI